MTKVLERVRKRAYMHAYNLGEVVTGKWTLGEHVALGGGVGGKFVVGRGGGVIAGGGMSMDEYDDCLFEFLIGSRSGVMSLGDWKKIPFSKMKYFIFDNNNSFKFGQKLTLSWPFEDIGT